MHKKNGISTCYIDRDNVEYGGWQSGILRNIVNFGEGAWKGRTRILRHGQENAGNAIPDFELANRNH